MTKAQYHGTLQRIRRLAAKAWRQSLIAGPRDVHKAVNALVWEIDKAIRATGKHEQP